MTVDSIRTRTLLVIPIRLVLGLVWLVGARVAGSHGGAAYSRLQSVRSASPS